MKILLTGATGNVGGHVLPLLLERGHDVRCLVFDSKNERKIVNAWERKPEVVWGDIQDERAVESAVAGVEAVIHLAAIIPPMTDQNPKLAYGVNVNGTRNLVNAAGKQTKRVRFIFTSTYDVYGNTQAQTPPRKVTLPVNPQEEYARHKVEAEKNHSERQCGLVYLPVGVCHPCRNVYEVSEHDVRCTVERPA
jgi:nucleoside-diphosphate-sugar epimerase